MHPPGNYILTATVCNFDRSNCPTHDCRKLAYLRHQFHRTGQKTTLRTIDNT
jgi:hypothetical protein